MGYKKVIFKLVILLSVTFILSGCSKKFDDYNNRGSFYLKTLKWGTSIEEIKKLKSDSNNIRTYSNIKKGKREDNYMMFQNIIYNEIEGYIAYNFYNNKKLYKIEYALRENKGEEKYNPVNPSIREQLDLIGKKEKYAKMNFELDYKKLVNYLENNEEEDRVYNDEIVIMVYNDLKNKYGKPSEIIMPNEEELGVKILWNTPDTKISLISRQNGLAGELRDLIVRYEDKTQVDR